MASLTINPNSYETFEKFSALFLETPANLNYAEVQFSNGHSTQMTIEELDSYFSLYNQSEANGRLGTVSVINNTDGLFKRVRLYTTGSSLTVLSAKLPQQAFDILTGK